MPFEDIEVHLKKVERRWRLVNTILPEFLAIKLVDIEWVHQQRKQRKQASENFQARIKEFRHLYDRLESDATVLQERSFDDPETAIRKISIRLDQANEQLTTIEQIDTDYLYTDEIDEVSTISESITRVEAWLESYQNVGRYVDIAEKNLNQVVEPIDSYREYKRYLVSGKRRDFLHGLAKAESAINNGFDSARETPLADEYLDKLAELQTKVKNYQQFVQTYNETFVSKEADRYEEPFTDIDEAGHDLSEEQQEAILHDDKYNLIVAGAGSGKTVTLTHRIAYLIHRQDSIPPNRILAISYTNNAADVMNSRLKSKFGIGGVETKTFHALGKEIIAAEWDTKPEVFLDSDRQNFVEQFIEQETDRQESEFKTRYFQFLKHFYDEIKTSAEFEEKESSVKRRIDDAQMSLKQEAVRSTSEKTIADFLFLNQIEYEYHSLQEWVEEVSGHGTYRADFYLPEYEIVLSHRPVTTDGNVLDWSPYSSFEDLQATVQWENQRFAESDTYDLVETYEFEANADRLEDALRARLVDSGVILEPLPYEEFIESAFNYEQIESKVMEIFSSFINNARQLDLHPDEVDSRVANSPPKEYAFGECASILYQAYCDHLENNSYVDFPGMLYKAIEVISDNPAKYENKYDHILVDEFQDVSRSKIELLKCFITPYNDTKLFCVGDDWQSIYSFSGSDVTYFIDFSEYFDTPHTTELTANYRCPATVVEAGNELIRNNDRQLEKTAEPATGTDTDIQTHSLSVSPHAPRYKPKLYSYVAELIEQYLAAGAPPDEIMVLSRTNSFYYDLEDECSKRGIKTAQSPKSKADPEEYVRLYSVHKSKGDEADHVIIIHAVEDIIGFPSQVEDEELLEPVRIAPEDNIAEERRLFYVALTRSSGTLDIVTSEGNESRFLDEIESYLSPASTLNTLSEDGNRIHLNRVWLKQSFGDGNSQTQAGILTDGLGSSRFVIWEDNQLDPLMDNTIYEIKDGRVAYNDYQEAYELHIDQYTEIEVVDVSDE